MAGPRRKKGGYDSALGSVFDFIFSNQKNKSRPLRHRPTGISSSDEFTRALAELAMNPASNVAMSGVNSLNDLLLNDVNFAEFKLDYDAKAQSKKYKTRDPDASRFRIRLSDLGTAFSDPNRFIDKALKGAKEDRRLARMTGLAAALDGVVATGIAMKSGMKAADAMTFGKTATISYGEDVKERHLSSLAENAAINAQISLAKKQATAEGLSISDPRFATRVREIAGSKMKEIGVDRAELARAMALSGTNFISSVGTDSPDFKAQVQRSKDEIQARLAKKYGDSPEAKEKIATLMSEFDKSHDRQLSVYGEGVSGFRLSYAENQALLAAVESNRKKAGAHQAAANLALSWERLKGDNGFAVSNTGASIHSLKQNIGKVSKQAEELQKLYTETERQKAAIEAIPVASRSAAQVAELSRLGTLATEQNAQITKINSLRNDLGAHSAKLGGILSAEQQRNNKSGDYFRELNIGSPKDQDVKLAKEAAQERIAADITQLKFDVSQTSDAFERRRLDGEIRRLEGMKSKITRFRGTDFRTVYDSWLSTGRAFRSQILQGGIGAGLISGAAFNIAQSGMYAPGVSSVVKTSGKMKVNGKEVDYTYSNKILIERDEINPHLARLTALSYFTPGSIIRTALWNQEGFDYLAYRQRLSIQRSFQRDKGDLLKSYIRDNPTLFDSIDGIFAADGSVNMSVAAQHYQSILQTLSKDTALGGGLKSVRDRALRKDKWSDRLTKFMKFKVKGDDGKYTLMSAQQLYRKHISGRIKEFKDKHIKERIHGLLRGLSKNKEWLSTVGQFKLGNLGVKQVLEEGIKIAFKGALKLVGLVPGAQLLTVVAWLGSEAMFKLAKPVLSIMMWAVLGLCMICGAGVFWIEGFANDETIEHALIPPTEIEYYVGGGPSDPGNPGGPIAPGNPGGTPPATSICPINPGATCPQGPFGSFSHAEMGTSAIDLWPNAGVWKAPTDGEVSAISYALKCPTDLKSIGGKFIFTDQQGNVYRALHVVMLVGNGPVTQGTPIARIDTSVPTGDCWTGPHFHLDTKSGGSWVNSLDWYNSLGCNIQGC